MSNTSVRESWKSLADSIYSHASAYSSPGGSLFWVPGAVGRDGRRVSAMEGFSRASLVAAFAASAEGIDSARELRNSVEYGVLAGLTGGGRDRWPSPAQSGQVVAEVATILTALRCTGRWRIPPKSARPLESYLRECLAVETPNNNWWIFRFIIASFMESVGLSVDGAVAKAQRSVEEMYYRSGWYSDGAGPTFDYYNSFSFHFYPALFDFLSRQDGDSVHLLPRELIIERMEIFLESFTAWFDPAGRPLAFGRSLTYKFGVAAALSASALMGPEGGRHAERRDIVDRCIRFFAGTEAMQSGRIELGWTAHQPWVAQEYSGFTSSLWAGKALVPLMLPQGHDFWADTATSKSAVSDADADAVGDIQLTVIGPMRRREAVEIYNHGSATASDVVAAQRGEDPFYDHFGYSSVTLPAVSGRRRDMSVEFIGVGKSWRRSAPRAAHSGPSWSASRAALIREIRWKPARFAGRSLARAYNALKVSPPVSRDPARLDSATLLVSAGALHILRIPESLACRRVRVTGWPEDQQPVRTPAGRGKWEGCLRSRRKHRRFSKAALAVLGASRPKDRLIRRDGRRLLLQEVIVDIDVIRRQGRWLVWFTSLDHARLDGPALSIDLISDFEAAIMVAGERVVVRHHASGLELQRVAR